MNGRGRAKGTETKHQQHTTPKQKKTNIYIYLPKPNGYTYTRFFFLRSEIIAEIFGAHSFTSLAIRSDQINKIQQTQHTPHANTHEKENRPIAHCYMCLLVYVLVISIILLFFILCVLPSPEFEKERKSEARETKNKIGFCSRIYAKRSAMSSKICMQQ